MGFADEVKGKAEEIGDKASDALDVAKDKAENAWDTVSDKAEDAFEVAKDKAEEAFEVAKDKATGIVDSIKDRFESGAEPPAETPAEDFAAAGPVPEDTIDRATVVEDAAAETERHSQPGQL